MMLIVSILLCTLIELGHSQKNLTLGLPVKDSLIVGQTIPYYLDVAPGSQGYVSCRVVRLNGIGYAKLSITKNETSWSRGSGWWPRGNYYQSVLSVDTQPADIDISGTWIVTLLACPNCPAWTPSQGPMSVTIVCNLVNGSQKSLNNTTSAKGSLGAGQFDYYYIDVVQPSVPSFLYVKVVSDNYHMLFLRKGKVPTSNQTTDYWFPPENYYVTETSITTLPDASVYMSPGRYYIGIYACELCTLRGYNPNVIQNYQVYAQVLSLKKLTSGSTDSNNIGTGQYYYYYVDIGDHYSVANFTIIFNNSAPYTYSRVLIRKGAVPTIGNSDAEFPNNEFSYNGALYYAYQNQDTFGRYFIGITACSGCPGMQYGTYATYKISVQYETYGQFVDKYAQLKPYLWNPEEIGQTPDEL